MKSSVDEEFTIYCENCGACGAIFRKRRNERHD